MIEEANYSLEAVIDKLKEKDVKTQLHILFGIIDYLKDTRATVEDQYNNARTSYLRCPSIINNYIKAMFLYNNLHTLSMYIKYLDSYLEELICKEK